MKKVLGILLAALLVATTACGAQEIEVQTGNPDSGQGTAQSDLSSGGEPSSTEPMGSPIPPAEPVSEFYDKMVTIPKEYHIEDYSNGYFIVTKSDGRLYGLLDPEGKTVIDFTYDELKFDRAGAETCPFVHATYDGKSSVVDLNGKVLIEPEYNSLIYDLDRGTFSGIKSDEISTIYFISKEGKIINTVDPTEALSVYKDAYVSSSGKNFFCCVVLDSADQVYIVLLDLQGKEFAKVKAPYNQIRNESTGFQLINASVLNLQGETYLKIESYLKKVDEQENTGLQTKTGIHTILDLSGNSHPELVEQIKSQKPFPKTDPSITYRQFSDFKDGKALVTFFKEDTDTDPTMYLAVINEKGEIIEEIASFDLIFISPSEQPQFIGNKALYYSNDTWKIASTEAPYKNSERYYGIQKLEEGEHWWLLENVDGENALLTPNGEIVVDFGNVTKDSFLGKPVLEYVISNEVCCFIIEGETENEVYVVKNQAKA
ncbi:WG repeat-containing protein [Anaeromassilibacillus senegalensis]|uniref:WG repeat-containing protein n=1 Tax=Anaeromassilibacillus senegalensis TaxID=1673717 RepID=UPI0006832E63|nr:WG repeat-containing protein [Anaeromassilibacillus senegalensis]